MLPAFIIDLIHQRERSKRESDRPQLELELPILPTAPTRSTEWDEETDRGVVVLDMF
jgi:hypothetical protein